MADGTDLYNVLEVSPRARLPVIKAAYDALRKELGGNDSRRLLAAVENAAAVLLDEKSRARYDRERANLEGRVIGSYRVLELIAEGGFGKTYKGEEILLKKPVCIKHAHNISPQDEALLIAEAASIWELRHYAIPTMKALLKLDDGSLALVMSYIPGPTLEKVVEKLKGLDSEHVCWITERVLNGLRYLHYNGVVHGDVKPQNIIIQPEAHTAVIVDYGLSMVKPVEGSSSKGYTPLFAPPEQLRGAVLLPESDFYSLGMTMIYALGGDPAKKKVPGDVPDSLCDFIKKLIVFDIRARPHWDKCDLAQELSDIRLREYGRRSSGMKPIRGF